MEGNMYLIKWHAQNGNCGVGKRESFAAAETLKYAMERELAHHNNLKIVRIEKVSDLVYSQTKESLG